MSNKLSRRDFTKLISAGALGLTIPSYGFSQEISMEINPHEFLRIPSPDYYNISHSEIRWEKISEGLEFSRTKIFREEELVDVLATIKINPDKNKFRVFNGNYKEEIKVDFIEDWQKKTGALAMINSNQYMIHYAPRSLVICDGKQKGPKQNKFSKGMFLAEPNDLENKLKKADILDLEYDNFNYKTTKYTQGVQHWPILLDRKGKIKVNPSLWQANRTIISKTKNKEILLMTTEGGYFTLYNFGRFLKESNLREDKGFHIHTAMNLDGGNSSEMILKSPALEYLNYGKFARRNPEHEVSPSDFKTRIPGVIGVFPRN